MKRGSLSFLAVLWLAALVFALSGQALATDSTSDNRSPILVNGVNPDPFAAPDDEVADLVARMNPPTRFADHKAQFTIREQDFTFQHVDGPKTHTWRVISDGERIVALLTDNGTFHLLAFRPQDAPRSLVMPTGRWHIDTFLGVLYPTGAFFPGQPPAADDIGDVEYRDTLTGEGTDRLVLTRRFVGSRPLRRVRPNRKPGESKYETIQQRLDTTNTFVLRCDPVHGYTIEGTFDNAVDPIPSDKQYVNLMAQGTYAMWPGEATSYRSVITPRRKAGYEGYYHNLQAFDLCDNHRPVFRNRGFGAFLNDQTGWSAAMTIAGAEARLVVCNAHADLDFVVDWPKDIPANDKGLHRFVVKHRLVALPPELTRHVWDAMDVRFKDNSTVVIELGKVEDFEDQPKPATTRVRGIINTSGLKLSQTHARSGSQSLLVRGMSWPNLPQISLKPNSRYRLEAWVHVEPMTDEQRAEHRARWESDRARREKKGETVEPYKAPGDAAEAYMTAYFYEWSPYSGQWLDKHQTNAASSSSDAAWQRVAVEFETPAWDPFVDIRFHCPEGVAYFDDFQLIRLGPASGGTPSVENNSGSEAEPVASR